MSNNISCTRLSFQTSYREGVNTPTLINEALRNAFRLSENTPLDWSRNKTLTTYAKLHPFVQESPVIKFA